MSFENMKNALSGNASMDKTEDAPRYATSKQISIWLSIESINKVKALKLNRTQFINDAVEEKLKGLK